MDFPAYFLHLQAYDTWANREVLAALKKARPAPPRSLGFMAHIYAAELLWFDRIQGNPQSVPVWPQFDLEQCEQQAVKVSQLWEGYLQSASQETLDQQVRYQNTKGEEFFSRVQDILMHVFMHSVYHRGQIAADMRAAGFTPAYTDYIHSVRQGLVA